MMRSIAWSITAGPGQLYPDAGETRSDGVHGATYHASKLEADEGQSVTVQARIS